MKDLSNRISAQIQNDASCLFSVWAPEKKSMQLHIIHPYEKIAEMKKDDYGYFSVRIEDAMEGMKYWLRPESGEDYPDPASQYQPEGVHGPSQVVDHNRFKWQDQLWKGLPLKDLILYEIHTGTFTAEGTFDAIIPLLKEISDTGINAIELMPVSQFPGSRNWGYDGVFLYAVQNSYGGPDGLKRLVDACHAKGIAVYLDVVYNHLGPEGNYLGEFGPYFTSKYHQPWGDAINFDGEWSDGVRGYFADNPSFWFKNYHLDGLRIDAIHGIFDSGAVHFWELTRNKISLAEQQAGRRFYMIAESDLNDPKVIKPFELGGYSFDAQWLDDFHHALYVMLDKNGKSRYEDFGHIDQLAKAYTDGFVHSGEFVRFRKRRYGASSAGIMGEKFVVFNQNHDQIGNRVKGERLSVLVPFEGLKVAAAALLLSPYIPLLFMGEEYGEDNPFYYFISHTEQELISAVREGRKKEFENYKWLTEPPDPQSEKIFNESKIEWKKRLKGKHKIILDWYKSLIKLRKSHSALQNSSKNDVRVIINGGNGFMLHRKSIDESEHILCFFNLSHDSIPGITFPLPDYSSNWTKILDSEDENLDGKRIPGKSVAPSEIISGGNLIIYGSSVVVYCNSDSQ